MIVVDCATSAVTLDMPACGGQVHSAQVYKAHGSVYDLSFSQGDDGKVALTQWPSAPSCPAGVYRLSVRTDCGCYDAPIYIDCPAPSMASDHRAGPAAAPPFIACIARNMSATTRPGAPVTITPADTGSVALAAPFAEHGTVSTDGSTLMYTPDADFVGEDCFGYAVTDATGTTATAIISVDIEDAPSVSAPCAPLGPGASQVMDAL